MRDLAQRGYLTEQNDGSGYAYYPALSSPDQRQPRLSSTVPSRPVQVHSGQSSREQITDLVPVRQSNGQLVHVLDDGRSKRLRRVPNEFLGGLNGQMFDDAPEVPQDNGPDNWWNPPPSGVAAVTNPQPRQTPSKAITVAPQHPPKPDPMQLLQGFFLAGTRLPLLQSEHSTGAVSERQRLKAENEALQSELSRLKSGASATQPPVVATNFSDPEPPDEEELSSDEPDEPLPPVDFETYRQAKSEWRRQVEHPDYSDDGGFAEAGTDASGRTVIKPTLPRPSLEELVEYGKLKRLDEEVARRRDEHRTAADHAQRTSAVRSLFAKAVARSKPDAGGWTGPQSQPQPQGSNTFWGRVKQHLSTPSKAVWK